MPELASSTFELPSLAIHRLYESTRLERSLRVRNRKHFIGRKVGFLGAARSESQLSPAEASLKNDFSDLVVRLAQATAGAGVVPAVVIQYR